MSEEKFEKLRNLARREFGVEIVRSKKVEGFKEVFGFDVKELREEKS